MVSCIVYPDEREPFTGRPVPYMDQDASRIWARHLSNWYILRHIEQHTRDFGERRQATRELATCQRKMDYWARHPNWDQAAAAEARRRMDELWRRT